MDDDELPSGPQPFTIPVPPPPPGTPPGDVFYFAAAGPGGPGPGPRPLSGPPREGEDILLRRVPSAVAMKFRAAAGGRGMTHAQYLAALVALQDAVRAAADAGDDRLREKLAELELQTVSV
jgi:hypothetical protein